jgi:hypothetical protein
MTFNILTLFAFFTTTLSFTTIAESTNPEISSEIITKSLDENLTVDEEINQLYNVFVEKNSNVPTINSFKNALLGYSKLEEKDLVEKKILTIVDFTLSSKKKRMWVLDMENNKVLFHSLVAHGQKTGGEFATKFSNKVNSHQSSLGFYVTGETYYGKNGLSMFIDGMEEKFNSKARDRYVVMHGANYANPEFINKLGRLGRSYGCPAIPTALTQDVIDTIKGKSVLYIHSADKTYLSESKMIQA